MSSTSATSCDCPVCYDKYTAHVRKPVNCPYCEFAACNVCTKKYLIDGVLDAHCMSCRRAWNDEFLDLNFTAAFRKGPYKKHREDVLLDREISILPTRQHRVEATIKLTELGKKAKEVHNELMEWEKERQKILVQSHAMNRQITRYTAEAEGRAPPAWTLNEGERTQPDKERAKFVMKCPADECRGFLSTAYKCGTCQKWACPDCMIIKGDEKDAEHTCDPQLKETVALIIKESKPCPKCGERISKIDGCFGRDVPVLMWDRSSKMSQDITAGDELIGDEGRMRTVLEVCSGEDELFEVTQAIGITYVVNSKHTLFLRSKDGVEHKIVVRDYMNMEDTSELYGFNVRGDISKIKVQSIGQGEYFGWMIDGNHAFQLYDTTIVRNCDQMWCIDCHTAFSWATGQQVNGVVHNPHYYEFLRKQGNGVAPRNAGDVPCGGVPYYHTLSASLRRFSTTIQNQIMGIHRLTQEMNDYYLTRYQGHFNVNDNGDLGVRYLVKEINKEQLKQELAKREVKRNKHLAIRAVLEMFVTTSTMMLNNIVNETPTSVEDLEKILTEYNNLRKYVNESLMGVSRMKSCSVPQVGENWRYVPFAKCAKKTRVVKKKGAVAIGGSGEDTSDDEIIEVAS